MISHATQAASVGAHRDRYDVFLIQLAGQRAWQLGTVADANLPEVDQGGSRLLQGFEPFKATSLNRVIFCTYRQAAVIMVWPWTMNA